MGERFGGSEGMRLGIDEKECRGKMEASKLSFRGPPGRNLAPALEILQHGFPRNGKYKSILQILKTQAYRQMSSIVRYMA